MDILRKTSVAIAASLLAVILFTTGLTWGLYQVLGKPDSIKSALRGSGLYETTISGALDQAQKQEGKEDGGEMNLPLERDDVRRVIEQAVPAEEIQTQAESVIDSVYAWLRGDTPTLSFTLNLTNIKTNLSSGLGTYLEQRLAQLPVCPAGTPVTGYDPFNADCLPAGMTPALVAQKAKADLESGEFLKDTTFTAEDFKDEEGKTLSQQLEAVPTGYQAFTTGMYAMLGVALLLALGVVFLSKHWRDGLRRTGIVLMSVGALSALMAWISNIALKWGVNRFAASSEDMAMPLQQKALKAVYILSSDLRSWWLVYGLVLLVVGLAIVLTLRFTKPKDAAGEHQSSDGGAKPETDETVAAAEKAGEPAGAAKPKPKTPRKLVQ